MISMVASDLQELMLEKGLTLSLAESCTGGMISSSITDRPGSSAYFIGSAITYSNQSKISILGVRPETISEFGAVSRETSVEMALGASRIFDTNISASVTGIAGPDGGSVSKPIGTVWMTVTDGSRCISSVFHFDGNRDDIRTSSTNALIDMIIDFVKGVL